jgi:uncharacterized protein YciI
MFLGGQCEEKSDLHSVVVLQASSETEAFEYIQNNPFVIAGSWWRSRYTAGRMVFEPRSAER